MKNAPTYVSYVIRIPQQDNDEYEEMFQNEYLDHFYEPVEIIVPWIFKAKFYLTRYDAEKSLKRLNEFEPTLIAEVKEVRLNLYE